jgi:hypothetical protein
MKTMYPFLAAVAALLMAVNARAQDTGEVCRVAEPTTPAVTWRGKAAYIAKATVKAGRVVGLEVRALTAGVERQVQRTLVMAIDQALRRAECRPGDHVFERRFDFDLREALTPEAQTAAERNLPVLSVPPTGNEVCRVEDPKLPVLAGRGQAAYLAGVELQDGRVLRWQVRALTPNAVARDQQRLPLDAIRAAMQAAQCPPGRHIIQKQFVLELREDAPPVLAGERGDATATR